MKKEELIIKFLPLKILLLIKILNSRLFRNRLIMLVCSMLIRKEKLDLLKDNKIIGLYKQIRLNNKNK